MIVQDEILNLIKENKPNCKNNSCRTYLNSFKKIISNYEKEYKQDIKNITFLKNVDKVIKILPEKLTTKKNYLTSILIIIKNNEKYKNEYKKYLEYTHKIRNEYDKHIKTQQKTESQNKNWIEWEEVITILKKLLLDVKRLKLKHKDTITKKEMAILQKYILLSLYVYQKPRRAEYSNMKIIDSNDYLKLDDKDIYSHNWLVVKNKHNKWFMFTNHKTSSHEGKLKVAISSKLNNALNLYLKFRKNKDWLLYNNKNEKLSSSSLTKHLMNIFKPLNKRISVSLLRHIWISHNLKNINLKKIKKDAEEMSHSLETHLEYIKV